MGLVDCCYTLTAHVFGDSDRKRGGREGRREGRRGHTRNRLRVVVVFSKTNNKDFINQH